VRPAERQARKPAKMITADKLGRVVRQLITQAAERLAYVAMMITKGLTALSPFSCSNGTGSFLPRLSLPLGSEATASSPSGLNG